MPSTSSRQWVWQRSPFSLSVVQDSATSWHLHGSTDYGENVMDEWFVVSLLQHVTREIHSLVARVTDADGENDGARTPINPSREVSFGSGR